MIRDGRVIDEELMPLAEFKERMGSQMVGWSEERILAARAQMVEHAQLIINYAKHQVKIGAKVPK